MESHHILTNFATTAKRKVISSHNASNTKRINGRKQILNPDTNKMHNLSLLHRNFLNKFLKNIKIYQTNVLLMFVINQRKQKTNVPHNHFFAIRTLIFDKNPPLVIIVLDITITFENVRDLSRKQSLWNVSKSIKSKIPPTICLTTI